MLKKEKMVPGSKIKITQLKNGLPKDGGWDSMVPITSIDVMDPNDYGIHKEKLHVGDELIVIKPPSRVGGGGNVCSVETLQGTKGVVYWCHLRTSCQHI